MCCGMTIGLVNSPIVKAVLRRACDDACQPDWSGHLSRAEC